MASELPPILIEQNPVSPSHERSDALAAQIRDLAGMGLSRAQVSRAARVSMYLLEKYYLDDYLFGQTLQQGQLAAKAMEEAMGGNTAILLHLLKTKLGWTETQVIEHTGEVRSVVSSKPLTKDEFVRRFLTTEE